MSEREGEGGGVRAGKGYGGGSVRRDSERETHQTCASRRTCQTRYIGSHSSKSHVVWHPTRLGEGTGQRGKAGGAGRLSCSSVGRLGAALAGARRTEQRLSLIVKVS